MNLDKSILFFLDLVVLLPVTLLVPASFGPLGPLIRMNQTIFRAEIMVPTTPLRIFYLNNHFCSPCIVL
jgi:hypothetical protein